MSRKKNYRVRRASSYDRTGGNADWWIIEPNAKAVLLEAEGPGAISHFWCTVNSKDPFYLRNIVLAMYWDGEAEPSVLAPIGDFFGLGHARQFTYQCALFSTSCRDDGTPGFGVAMNSWLEMPYRKSADPHAQNP